jgi:hypothetical protein
MTQKLDLPAPGPKPANVRATIRGTTYTITELPMERYNELLEKATTKTRNDITGEDEESVDNTLLMRLMILDAVKPKPDSLMKLGVRHYSALSRLVRDLHYGDEPVKIETEDESAEETPQGNAA